MLRIRGSSDDLINVIADGPGGLYEEFSAVDSSDEEPRFLAFSDGTVLRVWYDAEGVWRIRRVATGRATYWHQADGEADGETGLSDYSEQVMLDDPANGGIAWVVFGREYHRAPKNAIFPGEDGEAK